MIRDRTNLTQIYAPTCGSYFVPVPKQRVQESRLRAYRSVNKELIDLYWSIGREIAERQERDGWGKSVVERLSRDLRKEFPGTSGFSSQNLWYMRQFYLEYREYPNLQQVVGEIPWGQNLLIISRIKDFPAREYYLRMTAEMGWSRNVLLHQKQGKGLIKGLQRACRMI